MSEEKKNIVWIACRAKEGCTSNQAEVIMNAPRFSSVEGEFVPVHGGRMTRYRCQGCNRVFTIST